MMARADECIDSRPRGAPSRPCHCHADRSSMRLLASDIPTLVRRGRPAYLRALLLLEDISHDEDRWFRPFILGPVRALFPLGPTIPLLKLLSRASLALFGQRPLEDAYDRGAIFVAMQSDHTARFHGYKP